MLLDSGKMWMDLRIPMPHYNVWNDSNGMNDFIFDGYFDQIIQSFGWQNINIGIPLIMEYRRTIRKPNTFRSLW